MPSSPSTIVALATPPGPGGIAVVRLSGPDAWRIGAALLASPRRFEARRATVARVRGRTGATVDEAVILPFAAPASYTGEDVIEFSLHGSMAVASEFIAAAVGQGAVPAAPGEFTLRAFLNGRLDLAQAEAVRDLAEAATPLQARVACDQLTGSLSGRIAAIEQELFSLAARLEASVDFPDEGYRFVGGDEARVALEGARSAIERLLATSERGRVIREGATVAIAGRPNVGKSSLFNRLVGMDRAIVHEAPGTTRDLLIETVALGELRLTLADTAGVRASDDLVEREGVARASRAHAAADLVLLVLDGSEPLTREDESLLEQHAEKSGVAPQPPTAHPPSTRGLAPSPSEVRPRCLVVVNKADLPAAWEPRRVGAYVRVSCETGYGVDDLIEVMTRVLTGSGSTEALAERSAQPTPRSSGSLAEASAHATLGSAGFLASGGPAVVVTNARHVALLEEARSALDDGLAQLARDPATPEEVVLSDIQRAREALEGVTGTRAPDALLQEIFGRFCIGK